MIITIIITVVRWLLTGLILLLPRGGSLPAAFTTGLTTFWGYVNSFSLVIPVSQIAICIGLMLAWDLFEIAWRFIPWILKKIPFIHVR